MIVVEDEPQTSNKVESSDVTFTVSNHRQFNELLAYTSFKKLELMDSIRSFYNIPKNRAIQLHIDFRYIEESIIYEWERRLKTELRSMLELEKLMWNLSTLGGAYSAMGDFDLKFAETASKISRYQIILAQKFGDPTILARCILYIALSEAQMGRISNSLKIVKRIYKWSLEQPDGDFVGNCSKGVYKKIIAIKKFGLPCQNNYV